MSVKAAKKKAATKAKPRAKAGRIFGAHFLLYSAEPDGDREFLRGVLGFKAVDVGGGWLIMKLPPAEIAVHPADGDFTQQHAEQPLAGHVLYLMTGDVKATVKTLAEKNVKCTKLLTAPWGIQTTFRLPSGAVLGLYQPKHDLAIDIE